MAVDLLEQIRDFTNIDGYLINLHLLSYKIISNPKVQYRALQNILFKLNLQNYQEFSVIYRDIDQLAAVLRDTQNKEEFGYSAGLFFRSQRLLQIFLEDLSQNFIQKFSLPQTRRWKNFTVYQGKIENNIFTTQRYNVWQINIENSICQFLYSTFRHIENISFEIIPMR